ncbi:MAG: DUF4835 family protein [Bacteroidia bacterium]|nr:DUF4835 family protein [Bacteroidia bacterium]
MRLSIILFLLLGLSITHLKAQEFLVTVTINSQQIQGDKTVFKDMQQNISRYMNTTAFTQDKFEGHERIRVGLQIIVSSQPSVDYFVCQANFQVYRPAYNSTYETSLLTIRDNAFNFKYLPYQNMAYVQNTYTDNLTALLNFYAFVILGFDYDSFAPNGGQAHFNTAREIVGLASSSNESGWKSSEQTLKNRFWLAENLMNTKYRVFHQVLYKYHRTGIDGLAESPARGRKAILACLRDLQRLNRQNPQLYLVRIFCDTKNQELVKVFQNAFVNDQKEFLTIMQDVDPTNMPKYSKVQK